MFDTGSRSLHLAQFSSSEWLDFTVENRASTFTAAATLAPNLGNIQELKLYGPWLLETMSSVVGTAVGHLFHALGSASLKRLHLYKFPQHVSPDTLVKSTSHLTALTELVIENPNCTLTHRHVNALLGACSCLEHLRCLELPYYLQSSEGATEFCDVVSTFKQIECLKMHGCFRNVSALENGLSDGENHRRAYFEAPLAVARCLCKLTNLKCLELDDCFEGQELEEVMSAIRGLQYLTSLSLEGIECCTKRTTMQFAGIFAFTVTRRVACGGILPMLQRLTGLQHLNLSGLFLPCDHQPTAAAVSSMTGLSALCLSAVEVEAEFWHALSPKCTALTNLVRLDLSRVEKIDAAIMTSLAHSMACMRQLQDLHLTGTNIGAAAAAVFRSLRGMPALRKLGLGQCNITHAQNGPGLVEEMAPLSSLSSLKILILAYNDLGTVSTQGSPATV